jgi:hypothetical protein
MNSFNKLLIENYYKSINERKYTPEPSFSAVPPPPPNNPNDWTWDWDTNRPVQNVPDLPDQVDIDPTMDPTQVDPGDITMHGGEVALPPKPPEREGQILILMRRYDAEGNPYYVWEYIDQSPENPSRWQRILTRLGAVWRWFPAVGWVLFSPMEQQAGAGSEMPYLYGQNDLRWDFGWWWDPEQKKWIQTPRGGWDNVPRTRDTSPYA